MHTESKEYYLRLAHAVEKVCLYFLNWFLFCFFAQYFSMLKAEVVYFFLLSPYTTATDTGRIIPIRKLDSKNSKGVRESRHKRGRAK
jgi:hypothetical protein